MADFVTVQPGWLDAAIPLGLHGRSVVLGRGRFHPNSSHCRPCWVVWVDGVRIRTEKGFGKFPSRRKALRVAAEAV